MQKTKSEIRDKQICLLRIIFEVANSTNQLWKTVRLNSFQKTIISIPISIFSSLAHPCHLLFLLCYFNLSFYVSLNLKGILQLPNLAEFRDTVPLIKWPTTHMVKTNQLCSPKVLFNSKTNKQTKRWEANSVRMIHLRLGSLSNTECVSWLSKTILMAFNWKEPLLQLLLRQCLREKKTLSRHTVWF